MTQIEWTHMPGFKGETWNPVVGCKIVSKGCTNCYAMRQAARLLDGNAKTPHYAGTTKRVNGQAVWTGKIGIAGDPAFTAPLRAKAPRCYFVNSMGDLFAEGVPDEAIDRAFAVMALTPQHRYLILTKRPDRMRAYLSEGSGHSVPKYRISDAAEQAATAFRPWNGNGETAWDSAVARAIISADWPLPNVWLGVSVEDQPAADSRIPDLLATPAAVRFISAEPLLGPVDLRDLPYDDNRFDALTGDHWMMDTSGLRFALDGFTETLDWVIAGGESGKGARPMHQSWARGLRDQCAAAGVPFFFKQWGEWAWRADRKDGGEEFERVGKKAAGALLDGMEHRAFPVTEHGRAPA